MTARIAAATPPHPPAIQAAIDRIMRGRPPLRLFETLARDARLFERFFGGGLLDRGHLTIRQREIVIHRTTALCGAEYEWGVHVAAFAAHAGFDEAQLRSFLHGGPDDGCWDEAEGDLVRLCDVLHRRWTIDDALWQRLCARLGEMAMIELVMLAGSYHMVSGLVNALRLAPEPGAARFADYPPA